MRSIVFGMTLVNMFYPSTHLFSNEMQDSIVAKKVNDVADESINSNVGIKKSSGKEISKDNFFLEEQSNSHIVKIERLKVNHSQISGKIIGSEYVKSVKIKTKRVQGERYEEDVIEVVKDLQRRGSGGVFARSNLSGNRGKAGLYLTQVQATDLWGQVSASKTMGFRVVSVLEVEEIVEEGHPSFVVEVMGSENTDNVFAYFRVLNDKKELFGNIFNKTSFVKLKCELGNNEGITVCHGLANETLESLKKYEYWITVENKLNRLLSQTRFLSFVKHNHFVDKMIKEKLHPKLKVKKFKASYKGIDIKIENYPLLSQADVFVKKILPASEQFTKRYDVTEELLNHKGNGRIEGDPTWGEGVLTAELVMRDHDRYSVQSNVPTFMGNNLKKSEIINEKNIL